MSIPRAPKSILIRDEVDASDPSSYSSITQAEGEPTANLQNAIMLVKIEGTSPVVDIKLLVYDDDFGYLELAEGGSWVGATESYAAPVLVAGQRVFPHITIISGTSVKVSVKMSGYLSRLDAD